MLILGLAQRAERDVLAGRDRVEDARVRGGRSRARVRRGYRSPESREVAKSVDNNRHGLRAGADAVATFTRKVLTGWAGEYTATGRTMVSDRFPCFRSDCRACCAYQTIKVAAREANEAHSFPRGNAGRVNPEKRVSTSFQMLAMGKVARRYLALFTDFGNGRFGHTM